MSWADGVSAEVDDWLAASPAGPPDAPPDPPDDSAAFQAREDARRLQSEVDRQRRRRDAAELLAAERAVTLTLPPLTRLDHFLAADDPPVSHRVAGLWPAGGRVVLAAQQKAGKTTLAGNLLRSLADGVPFLDRFSTVQAGRVVLIDNELDDRMLRRWLRTHRVAQDQRIELLALRGRLSTFNILDPATRNRWAGHLGSADVIIFDCLRPALDALGLSEDKEAGRFLEAFDELTTAAGIGEALVVHHMGHSNERSRGDSRILDWPDAIWNLVIDNSDDESAARSDQPRYFNAHGRDVDQPETRLTYTADTRRLSIGAGNRRDTRQQTVVEAVVVYVYDQPGASQNQIETELGGRRDLVRDAVRGAVRDGLIDRRRDGRAFRHYPRTPDLAHSPDLAPGERANPLFEFAHSPIGRGANNNEHPGPLSDLAPGE